MEPQALPIINSRHTRSVVSSPALRQRFLRRAEPIRADHGLSGTCWYRLSANNVNTASFVARDILVDRSPSVRPCVSPARRPRSSSEHPLSPSWSENTIVMFYLLLLDKQWSQQHWNMMQSRTANTPRISAHPSTPPWGAWPRSNVAICPLA